MFAESLIDASWADRSRRGWTTMASFGFLAFAVGVLMALPVLYPEGISQLRTTATLISPAPLGDPAPVRPTRGPTGTHPFVDVFHTPTSIPRGVDSRPDSGAGEEVPGPPTIGDAGPRWGDPNGVRDGLGPVTVAPPRPVLAVQTPLRVSVMMEGNLIHRVEPIYPYLAIQARIQGDVILQAVISREGTIENLHVVSGHPMLSPAAMNAVKQWRYRPYKLNGEPVEVETQVTVKFSLAGNQ